MVPHFRKLQEEDPAFGEEIGSLWNPCILERVGTISWSTTVPRSGMLCCVCTVWCLLSLVFSSVLVLFSKFELKSVHGGGFGVYFLLCIDLIDLRVSDMGFIAIREIVVL